MSSEDTSTTASVTENAEQTSPASPAPAAPAESAPSPSAPEPSGETHQSLLEAVQSAVPELRRADQQDDDGKGASPAPSAQSDQAQAEYPGDSPEELSKEELDKLTHGVKQRIYKLAKQKHELRAEVERLRGMEPQAQAADSVTKYLRDNDIGREDFLHGLDLMTSIRRGDFQRFYAGIKPYVDLAEQYLGISLAPDLQQAVRQGQMTTEAAVRFGKERMDRAILQNQHERTQQTAQQQQQYWQQTQEMQQREVLANTVKDHVNQWERTVAAHDPDYGKKAAAVRDTMWAVVRETGKPQSPEAAVGIAREAYRRVNEHYRSWAPPMRPTSRNPSSTGRSTGAAPEPKNLLDVVRQARENARA